MDLCDTKPYDPAHPEPVIIFHLHYRPRDYLTAQGIIPRSTSAKKKRERHPVPKPTRRLRQRIEETGSGSLKVEDDGVDLDISAINESEESAIRRIEEQQAEVQKHQTEIDNHQAKMLQKQAAIQRELERLKTRASDRNSAKQEIKTEKISSLTGKHTDSKTIMPVGEKPIIDLTLE